MDTGHDYSWFILTRRIIEKEFALSGSEQNPDLTGKRWSQVLARARKGVPGPIKSFMDKGEDFIVERDLGRLVARMNELAGGAPLLRFEDVEREITARDRQLDNPVVQGRADHRGPRGARAIWATGSFAPCEPHRLLDPAAGPLIAVRLTFSRARRWAVCKPISKAG